MFPSRPPHHALHAGPHGAVHRRSILTDKETDVHTQITYPPGLPAFTTEHILDVLAQLVQASTGVLIFQQAGYNPLRYMA